MWYCPPLVESAEFSTAESTAAAESTQYGAAEASADSYSSQYDSYNEDVNFYDSATGISATVSSPFAINNFNISTDQITFEGLNNFTALSSADIASIAGLSLDDALSHIAGLTTQDEVIFNFGGSTYIYADKGETLGQLDNNDLLVQLNGNYDVNTLLSLVNYGDVT